MVEITSKIENDLCIIDVSGEIDASSSINLDEELEKALSNNDKIIINLAGLEYISSAGLGVFMSYIQEVENKNAQMVLFGMKEKVSQVFQILGLDQLLRISDTQESAIKEINGI